MCDHIIALKPDLVITEKGLSGQSPSLTFLLAPPFKANNQSSVLLDLAQHYFVKAGITALRRLKKTDNLRIARFVQQ